MSKLDELLEDLEEVRRLTVRPGDTLVFRFRQRLDRLAVEEIGAHLKTRLGLGDDVMILVLDQGATLDILEKNDGATPS